MGLSHSFKRLLLNLSVTLRFPDINVTVCSTFIWQRSAISVESDAAFVSVCVCVRRKREGKKKKRQEFSESTQEGGLVTENGNLHVTR